MTKIDKRFLDITFIIYFYMSSLGMIIIFIYYFVKSNILFEQLMYFIVINVCFIGMMVNFKYIRLSMKLLKIVYAETKK